jgi:mRNA-degrading endonuclease RelE of RelBE toxin-antitoxin system
MKVDIGEQAIADLQKMDRAQLVLFGKHIDKIADNPSGRHMKHGMPYFVEEVGQGRIVYRVVKDTVFVLRCFASHKEYEKWYKS